MHLIRKTIEALKLCHFCEKPLDPLKPHSAHRKFCDKQCKKADQRRRYEKRNPHVNIKLSPATVGAAAELAVCADLLQRGYEVFRAVSPACSCDLIILRDNQTKRVEVKSGNYRVFGELVCFPSYDKARCDVLAVYLGDKILYSPDI
jgi:hypothetical protein